VLLLAGAGGGGTGGGGGAAANGAGAAASAAAVADATAAAVASTAAAIPLHLLLTGRPSRSGLPPSAEGVLLVTVNYRLGVFGFLASTALSNRSSALDGANSSGAGNYGILDQVLHADPTSGSLQLL